MNSATLLENFDLLADAPGGVPKLRGLILQLAVRGKLVPQEEGEVHHEGHEEHEGKKEGERIEGPYAVPPGWRWTTLAQAGKVNPRNEAADDMEVGFAPMAVISDRYGVTPAYERRLWRDVKKGFTHFAEGDIGVAKITPCFENGKSAVFRNVPNGIGAGTTELHIFRPVIGMVIPDYVWIFLKSPRFRTGGEAVMTGSAGQKRVPADYFAKTPFPLPPLAEQKRIVARVDELMKRCDELEARQKERNERRTVLTASCLHAVTSTPRKAAAPAIDRALNNFPLLIDTPESVAELRKTILQLAVQGRLVPQDTREASAETLLEAIRAERAKRVRDGSLREGPDSMAPASRRPCASVPVGWVIQAFGSLVFNRDGERVPVSRADREKRRGDFDYYGASGVIDKIDDYLFDQPLLLIGEDGANLLNRSTPIAFVASGKYWVNNHAHVLEAINDDLLNYLTLFINATDLRPYITGTAQPKMNQAKMNSIPVALPPLAEQKRIVAKVSELVALCDALEANLTQSRAGADTLAAAVVHYLCNGGVCRKVGGTA